MNITLAPLASIFLVLSASSLGNASGSPSDWGISIGGGIADLGPRSPVRPMTATLEAGDVIGGGAAPWSLALAVESRLEYRFDAPGLLGRQGLRLALALADGLTYQKATASRLSDGTTSLFRFTAHLELGLRAYFPVRRDFIAFFGTGIGFDIDEQQIDHPAAGGAVTDHAELLGAYFPLQAGLSIRLDRELRLGPTMTYAFTTAGQGCLSRDIGSSSNNNDCKVQLRPLGNAVASITIELAVDF